MAPASTTKVTFIYLILLACSCTGMFVHMFVSHCIGLSHAPYKLQSFFRRWFFEAYTISGIAVVYVLISLLHLCIL